MMRAMQIHNLLMSTDTNGCDGFFGWWVCPEKHTRGILIIFHCTVFFAHYCGNFATILHFVLVLV